MQIEFSELSANQRYHILTQTVIPRPIAWVLSENTDRSLNLAPFSFFNAICSDPALLMISIGKKDDGVRKDTAVNILSEREFTVHIANDDQAEMLTSSAATRPYGDSELEELELTTTHFEGSNTTRLEQCDIAFRCKLYDTHYLGPNEQCIVYCEVLSTYVSDSVVTKREQRISIHSDLVRPLARLGAAQYATAGKSFSLRRPK